MISLLISTINSIKAKTVKLNRTKWEHFVTGFLKLGHQYRAYKNRKVALFNLTQFDGGRKKENAKNIFGAVLDWDGQATVDEIEEWLDGWEYIMYSSFRHREDGETDKVKTIIPFKDACDVENWMKRSEGAKRYFRDCDPSSLSVTQFQAMPNCPKSRRQHAFIRHIKGELFDWRLIPIIHDDGSNTELYEAPSVTWTNTSYSSRSTIAPDTVIHHKNGFIKAGDITEHVRDVFCPNHPDNTPTEFANVNKDGKPYIVCTNCGTLWVQDVTEHINDPIFNGIDVANKPIINDIPVKKPLDWTDTLDTLNDIRKNLSQQNVLLWPEGTGKSYLAKILCDDGKKVLFACRSNKQAEEKFESFSKLGLSVKMLSSRSHEIEKKYGIKPVRFAKTHPWDEGRINEQATYKKIIELNPELSDLTASDLLSNLIDGLIDWENTNIVVTTHARLGHLGRLNIQKIANERELTVPEDVIIFYDDPDNDDFMTLSIFSSSIKKQSIFGQPIETFYPESGNDFYYIKPAAIRPGFGFNDHQLIVTTTELTILALIKQNYPVIKVHDQLLPNDHKIFGGNIHLISTKLVRSSVDGVLPPIMERVRRLGFEFEYIANGQGCEVNLSNNKGMNQFTEQNLVIEVSVPTKDEIRTLYEQFDRKVKEKKIKFLIMLDRIHQAVGRNSGYRWKGKECVVLIDPLFFKLAQQYSRYSFESVIEGDKENSQLFPSRRPEFTLIHQAVGWYINRHIQYIRNGNEFKFDCQKCLKTTLPNLRNGRLKRLLSAIDTLKTQNQGLTDKLELIKTVIEPEEL